MGDWSYTGRRGRKPKRIEVLSDELLQALPVEPSEYTVHDKGSGLIVRVRPNGTKTLCHRSRQPQALAQPRALGSASKLTVDDARALALRHDLALWDEDGSDLSPQSRLADAVKEYLVNLECNRSYSYYRKAKTAFRKRIVPGLGNVRVSALTLGKIENYILSRYTAGEQRNDRAFISSFLTWLVSVGALKSNFMRGSYVPKPRIVRRFSARDNRNGTDEAIRLLKVADGISEPASILLALTAVTGFSPKTFLAVHQCPDASPGASKWPQYGWAVQFPQVGLGPHAQKLSTMGGIVPDHLSGRTANATRRKIMAEAGDCAGDSHVRGTARQKSVAKLVEEEITTLRMNLEDWEQHLQQVLAKAEEATEEVTL